MELAPPRSSAKSLAIRPGVKRRRRSSRRRRRSGWLRILLTVLAVLIVGFAIAGALAVLHALHIERRLNALPATLNQAEQAAESGDIKGAQADLLRAQDLLTSANSALYNSPEFEIVGVLPIAHQNLVALRRATTLGLQLIGGGEDILSAAAPLEGPSGHLDVTVNGGRVPVAAGQNVHRALITAIGDLPPDARPKKPSFVIGKIWHAEQRVYAEAARRRAQFGSVAAALQLVDDIAGASGNRRYLIAVANSAEMRGSGGMILSYGVLTSHAGRVTLGHFGDIDELLLNSPETAVSFPADFAARYGGLAPTQAWRNANIMSDFTVDAPVLEAMYKKKTGLRVDGVIQVDSAGLSALLAGVGPVQTAQLGTVTPSNVVTLTLSTAYALYPNRTARQDYTGQVAEAAFARLTNGRFPSLRPLGTALIRAAEQRHVLMYTNDPIDETDIANLGFDGALPYASSAFTQLTVQNFGADKLDYYLTTSLTLTGQPPSLEGDHVQAVIELGNTAPQGRSAPVEVFGPFTPTNPHGVPGDYIGLVTLYLPAGSFVRSSHGDATITTPAANGSQNGVATVTYTVSIPAGGRSTMVLDLFVAPTLPSGGHFLFVPSPRVIPTVFRQRFN